MPISCLPTLRLFKSFITASFLQLNVDGSFLGVTSQSHSIKKSSIKRLTNSGELTAMRYLVGGVSTGLNISQRLKTNDRRTYRKRWYLRNIWKKNGYDASLAFKFFFEIGMNFQDSSIHICR